MSADHKRPLLAFVLVTIACLLIVVNAARSEALRSALHHGADRVAAGVRLALEDDDSAPVAAAAPRSFDRDDERAVASRRLPAASMLLPGPSVALPSISAASVEARRHVVPAPRHRAASRDRVTSRPQQVRQAHRSTRTDHPRATAAKHRVEHRVTHGVTHGVTKSGRAAHARTASAHAPRARAVDHGPARVAPHRSPARATSAHRTASRHHHARAHHGARHHHR